MGKNDCVSYKKPVCWNSVSASPSPNSLCSTCQKQKDSDSITHFLLHSLDCIGCSGCNEDSLLNMLEHVLLKPHFNREIDKVIKKMYDRDRNFSAINRNSTFYKYLLLRVKIHNNTDLCEVYPWLLRRNVLKGLVLPTNCLKCLAATYKFGFCNGLNPELRKEFHRYIIYANTGFKPLLLKTIPSTPLLKQYKEFYYSLVESDDLFAPILLERYKVLLNEVIPLSCGDLEMQMKKEHPLVEYKYKNCRSESVKEDLMIRTWHPDRFIPWCLDEEDKKDFSSSMG